MIEDASVLADKMTVNTADDDTECWLNDEAVDETVSLENDDTREKSENIEGKERL